jgi:hypothetical protein
VNRPRRRPGVSIAVDPKEAQVTSALNASEPPPPEPLRNPIPPELPASPDPPDIPTTPVPSAPPDAPPLD